MSAIFLSDVHLRDASSVKTGLVVRFLQEVASQYSKVFILGDLFDVWPGTTPFLVKSFGPVLDALKRLVRDGHEVHYVEGNHDFRLGSFFHEHLGVKVYPESIEENWSGKRIYMAHGDLGNPSDYGYRALRYLLRTEVVNMAARVMPGEWVFQVGLRSSQLSRAYQTRTGMTDVSRETAIRQVYRNAADKLFRSGFDLVIMGHTHLPDDVTTVVEGRQCRYINLGDWIRNFTYLEFDGAQFYTKSHPVKDL